MSDDLILICLICFILGWFVSRHIGNGFSVGCELSPGEEEAVDLVDRIKGWEEVEQRKRAEAAEAEEDEESIRPWR